MTIITLAWKRAGKPIYNFSRYDCQCQIKSVTLHEQDVAQLGV